MNHGDSPCLGMAVYTRTAASARDPVWESVIDWARHSTPR
jgi:hypothetical protein